MVAHMAQVSVRANALEVRNLRALMQRVREATDQLNAGFTLFAAARDLPKANLVSVGETDVTIEVPDE